VSSNSKNVTAADVAAQAAEDKLVVPAQGEKAVIEGEKTVDPNTEKTVVEDEKKSLKDRLAGVTEQLKKNKKVLIAVGAAAGVAALTFAKYAKNKAELALIEVVDGETETVDGQSETPDDSAV
jgi:hypothetical protein